MREGGLQNDIVVQVVLEVLCALAPSVAVIHPEYLQFWPLVRRDSRLLLSRLDDVKNDRYSVFVGLSDRADIRIGGEGLHSTECLRAHFTSLEEWQRALWLVFE